MLQDSDNILKKDQKIIVLGEIFLSRNMSNFIRTVPGRLTKTWFSGKYLFCIGASLLWRTL